MTASQAALSSTAAGTGLQVAGQIYGAVEASRIGRYNARVARANAQQEAFGAINEALQHERLASMLHDEEAFVESMRLFQQARLDESLDNIEGEAVARIGASGLAVRGSPLAVLEENARQGQIRRLVIDHQARLQTRALREEQVQQRYAAAQLRFGAGQRLRLGRQQGDFARLEGRNRAIGNIFGAVGDVATGASRLGLLNERQGQI
jgi:hypothetical protein